jgi:CHAT domain-containing protein
MERSKARTLLDVVAGEPLAPKGPEVVRLARSAPLVLQRLRGASQAGRLAPEQFERELSQSLERLADQAEAQELLSLASVRPASLKAVQAALDGEQLLIEYLATEQELLAAVVSRDGLRIERLPDYGAAALGRAVAALRGLAQDPRSRYEDQARKLFDGLLAPCLSANPRATHLVIVPSGALHYLPFQALVDSAGKFVVERRMVSYAPSATALLYCLQKGKATEGVTAGGALVVGQSAALAAFPDFPPLPCAEREAEQVHARFRSALPLLQNASETAVKAALPKAGVLHFAGHAEMVPNAPLRSALLCGDTVQDDGRLEVRELFAMDLRHCRMAVLSACRTQVGQWSRGDEMVGLSAAFLRAGVPTVVASLWDLPDEPAARIMVRFYEGLDSRGAMRLAALCQAQRDYLAGKLPALPGPPPSALVSRGALALGPLPKTADAYRHPYYWAGFQLLGDWR